MFGNGKLTVDERVGHPENPLFGLEGGRRAGEMLGTVTRGVNVGEGVAFRVTERAFTALLLCHNISVAAIRGLLKREDMGAARVCDTIASLAVRERLEQDGENGV